MKKLLSILAAVGLTATASTSVVACGKSDGVDNKTNNPSHTYEQFMKWVDASKKSSKTELVFVGGRNDVDTLSWLAAREQYTNIQSKNNKQVNTSDTDALQKTSNVDNADDAFSFAASKDTTLMSSVKLANQWTGQGGSIGKDGFNSPLMTDYFWKDHKDQDSVELHTILVDKISGFFGSGVGSAMCSKWLNDQVTGVNTWKHSQDNQKPLGKDGNKQKKREIKDVTANITTTLKGATGPFFLVINNGHLAGITSGFINFTIWNKDSADVTVNDSSTYINDLFSVGFGQNVWGNLPTWLKTNFEPHAKPGSDFVSSDTSISNWSGKAATGKTKSKDDSSNNGSPTKAYKLDVRKYMD